MSFFLSIWNIKNDVNYNVGTKQKEKNMVAL